MLPSFILSLREGIEAALVIGIVLGALRQTHRRDLTLSVWLGAGSAVVLSLASAILLTRLGVEMKDPGEAIFEGLTMLLASGILTWMIFWMSHQARDLKSRLENKVKHATLEGLRGLFLLAFIAVLREGLELALFLAASAYASNAHLTFLGSFFGLVSAALLGWLLFASSIRLDLRRFFQVTGFLLILFAAGLIAHSVNEFIQLGWMPAIVSHIWNLNPILSDQSTLGQILAALFGYNSSPSFTEVLAYALYFVAVALIFQRTMTKYPKEIIEGSA